MMLQKIAHFNWSIHPKHNQKGNLLEAPRDSLLVVNREQEVAFKMEVVAVQLAEAVPIRADSTSNRMVSFHKLAERLSKLLVVVERHKLVEATTTTAEMIVSWIACHLWLWAASGR